MHTWKRSALVVVLLSLLSISLLQAQETTPEPAPAPEVTPEIIVPTEVLPTAAPSETPSPLPTDPTTEVPPTEVPTQAASPTAETTPEPAAETTPEPAAETTPEPTVTSDPLSLVFSTGFEAAAPELSVQGWLAINVDNGQALQSGPEASTLSYNTAYADAALGLRALLNDGTLSLALRQNAASGYVFILNHEGALKLLRDGLEIASAQVALVPGEWITLEARAIGGTLSASVNGAVVFSTTDAAPLPLGGLSVASSAAALLRIDDLTILASGAGAPQSTPAPTTQPTETVAVDAAKPVETMASAPIVAQNSAPLPNRTPEGLFPLQTYRFDNADDTLGWTLRSWGYNSTTKALQPIGEDIATLDAYILGNASLSAAVNLPSGTFRLYGRLSSADGGAFSAYAVEYRADGTFNLLRNAQIVASASRPSANPLRQLSLAMVGGQITASVDGEPVLSFNDSLPLAPGVFGLQVTPMQFVEGANNGPSVDELVLAVDETNYPSLSASLLPAAFGTPQGQAVVKGAVSSAPPSGSPPAGKGYLGDRVWHDLDRDGQQDIGEPGIPNVEVQLWSGTQQLATGQTAADGTYWWLVNGGFNYYTVIVPPQGFIFTNPDIGNNASDSDGQGNGSHPATFISTNEVDYSWDFGLLELTNICPGDTTLEIALVLDGSGSIGTTDFNKVRNFAAGLIDSFTIGSTATRFSIVQFSYTSYSKIELPLTANRDTLINKIRSMSYQGGSTDITKGLNLGQSTLSGGRNVQQVPRAIVLFTDGAHNGSGDPVTEAQLIKNAKTIIYSVGVGGYSLTQLNNIASDPDSRHVFTMNNFNELVNSLQSISTNTCNTPVVPYTAPVLTQPTSGIRTNNTMPTLSWQAVPYVGARYDGFYQVVIADNSAFSSPVIDITTTDLSFTPSGPLPTLPTDKTYYWKVIPWNSVGQGPASLVRTFILDVTPPNAPNLSAPADAAALTTAKPAFSWSAVSSGGTTSYRLQVDDNSNFGSPVIDQVVSTTSYTPTTPAHQSMNYWRVQATDQAGNPGPWSAVRSFSVNSASTPVDDYFFINANVGAVPFTWSSLSGASNVRLQISDSSSFASLLRNFSIPTTATSYTLSGSNTLPAGIYYWRLAVNVGFGLEISPFFRKLTVTPPAPPVPALITPDRLFTKDTTPTLDWNAVNYPYAGVTITYQVQISSSSTFSGCASGCQYSNLSSPGFTQPSSLSDGLYYWRVKTINMYGLESAWSAARTFTVDTVPPAAPTLTAPVGTIITLVRPAFSWAAVTGATSYRLDVSSNNFANLLPDYSNRLVTTTSFTGSTSVAALPTGLYQWRVRAVDAAGNEGPYSQTGVFYVTTPLPPTPVITQLEGLASGAPFTNDQTPDASTTPVTPPALPNVTVSYEFQISTTSTFTPATTVIVNSADNLLDDADWAAASVTQLPASPGQLYSVRVRLVYTGTNPAFGTVYGPFSAVRTFTLDNVLPTTPNLNLPAANATMTTARPAFSWVASPTANQYRLQLSLSADLTGDAFSSPLDVTGDSTPDLFTSTTTSFTLANSLGQGDYFWQVQARDPAGNWGLWSAPRRFTVNLLKSPLNNAALITTTGSTRPSFTWYAALGATGYQIEIANNPAFSSHIHLSPVLASNTLSYGLPTSVDAPTHGLYYWRLIVQGQPAVSNVFWAFSVTPTLPAAPVLVSPNTASLLNANQGQVALTWNAVTYGAPLTYEVQVDNQTTFTSLEWPPLGTPNTSATSVTTSDLPEGTYNWRVRAVNTFSGVGAWSLVRTFTVDKTAPLPPALSAPADNATVTTLTPAFSWSAVTTATRYEIQLDTLNPPQRTYLVTTTKFTPPSALLANRSYFWRVRAFDAAGNPSDWSVQRQVNLTTPTTAIPILNSYGEAQVPLSWSFISWATGYEIQVDDSSTFTAPLVYTGVTTNRTLTTPPLANGTYYWRVRVRNAANVWGAWSPAATFVVDVP